MKLRRRHHEPEPTNVSDLEREIERDRQEADEDLTKRINAAVCAEYGHERPTSGPLADEVEIVTWGVLEPVRRLGPHCKRCGADLGRDT